MVLRLSSDEAQIHGILAEAMQILAEVLGGADEITLLLEEVTSSLVSPQTPSYSINFDSILPNVTSTVLSTVVICFSTSYLMK